MRSNQKAATGGTSIALSVADGQAAFERLQDRLQSLPHETLLQPNVDVQSASIVAFGVAQRVNQPELRKRFHSLTKTGEYDDSCVDELGEAAAAAWYARHCFVMSMSNQKPKIPQELVDKATEQRARMMRLAEYMLHDDSQEMAVVEVIRAGSGYQDLANDLWALAGLYEKHKEHFQHDKKLYRDSDMAQARQLTQEILQHLGSSSVANPDGWAEAQSRAWTFLLTVYGQVRRGAYFLFDSDPHVEANYPSLIGSARVQAEKKAPAKKKPQPGSQAPQAPAEGAPKAASPADAPGGQKTNGA